jgi:hypothetical protein
MTDHRSQLRYHYARVVIALYRIILNCFSAGNAAISTVARGVTLSKTTSIIQKNGNSKESIKRRRLRASIDDNYRWQLLTGGQT